LTDHCTLAGNVAGESPPLLAAYSYFIVSENVTEGKKTKLKAIAYEELELELD